MIFGLINTPAHLHADTRSGHREHYRYGAWMSASRSSQQELRTCVVCHMLFRQSFACSVMWTNSGKIKLAGRKCTQPMYIRQASSLLSSLQKRESGIFLSVPGAQSRPEISLPTTLGFCSEQPLQTKSKTSMQVNECINARVCCRYFVAYSFDTTLGVALAIGIHIGAVRICIHWADASPNKPTNLWKLIADCGNYGERHQARRLLHTLCALQSHDNISCCAWTK